MSAPQESASKAPIVIIGAGMAGFAVARELKARQVNEQVLILTADEGAWYSKPLLSHVLSARKPAEALLMARKKAELTYNARIHEGSKVVQVDTTAKTVTCEDASVVKYSRLVLASGARAIQPWKGSRVFSVNSAADMQKLEPDLQNAHRVLIAGAGFVGLEFANDWARAGKSITVASLEGPLANVVPPTVSAWVEARLEKAGVRFIRGRVSLEASSDSSVRVDVAGVAETFDLLLSAVGLTAEVDVWKNAGIVTGPHGVTVNERFQTNVEDVYALGDVMEYQGRPWRFVAPLSHAAKVIADNLSGVEARENFGSLGINLKCPDAPLSMCLPPPNAEGSWTVDSSDEFLDAKFLDGAVLKGYVLGGSAASKRAAYSAQLHTSR